MKRTHRTQSKEKEPTDLQRLKEDNRNLRSENRTLKKQLKRLQRKEHSFEETQYEDPEDIQIPLNEQKQRCPSCNKGELVYVNIVGRSWTECTMCDYRTKTIKI